LSDTPLADPFEAYMAEFGDDVIERINLDFEDAVLMVGAALGGRPEATRVTVTAIDATGLAVDIEDPDGTHQARIGFSERLEVPDHLTTALIDLLTRAREATGSTEQTAAEREAAALAEYRTFVTEVVAVQDVHPHLRRVTFGGGDLVDFEPAGPDTFLYLLLPPPGRDELTIDQSFTWEQHGRMAPEEQPVGAYYTLREWRPETAELDMLMVLHGDAGHASAWAMRAHPGNPVALWGPRTAYHPPEGTDRLVLIADETGLPAVAVILEQLPDTMSAIVVAEVASEDERQELPERAGVEVRWLHRDGAPAGTTTLLVDAVRSLPPFEGRTYVWGGAESRAMTAVRRHVRDERGLDREDVSLVAYWRHELGPDDQSTDAEEA
jgi:NADPH-dependent ferric siderophore reductase